MMDKFYILTCGRPDNQDTYIQLPKSIQERTTLVVQEWERDKHTTDCDYLVLPDSIHYSDYLAVAKTRHHIYTNNTAKTYCIMDDDIAFKRKNSKYFSDKDNADNMERSKRAQTDDDVLDMFTLLHSWLCLPEVTACGIAQGSNPPPHKSWTKNGSLAGFFCFDDEKFKSVLPECNTLDVKYGEDTLLCLDLLSRGHGNRVSHEFCFINLSLQNKNMASEIWDNTSFDDVYRDHKIINKHHPQHFFIPLDENGERVKGGYRNYGKVRKKWSQCFKDGLNIPGNSSGDLTDFL